MQVRIQYRFLMKLLAFLAVMALVLFGWHRFQINRNSLQVLAQARKATESNKPYEAIRLYNQFLGLRRDSAEAHVELGDILFKQGNHAGALPLYESALRIDPKLYSVRESVVKIAIDAGRYVDAKETLSSYLIPNAPDNAEYQWLLGVCEYRIGEFAEAEKYMTLA
ncbi:MAG: tetratricopeptide repeat protein, partial [Pirellula staleyi]